MFILDVDGKAKDETLVLMNEHIGVIDYPLNLIISQRKFTKNKLIWNFKPDNNYLFAIVK